ncbi:MAG: AI-2E family transporter [Pseudomonadota bacterium]|nr:AI-2E family transporter [Pseudomonadota bacterium]
MDWTVPATPPSLSEGHKFNLTEIFTGGIFFLAALAACYVASSILLPICVAFLLNLVFRPVMRFFLRHQVPRGLVSLTIILMLVGGFVGLGTALAGPVGVWGDKLPGSMPKLQERLQFLIQPVTTIKKTVTAAETVTDGKDAKVVNVAVSGARLSDKLFSSTRVLVSEIFEMLLVLFFLLLSGDTFLQRFLEVLPNVTEKKKALEISAQIERDISAYLRTITLMNLLVGILTGVIMTVCGVGDGALWGTVAFLLNFVPILGPMTGIFIFAMAGMIANDSLTGALWPAGLFLAVHVMEGEMITPMILARRFTLNPALLILMLIFWYWMWGVAGAVLATPMLAILKIVCDGFRPLQPVGHLIEG